MFVQANKMGLGCIVRNSLRFAQKHIEPPLTKK